MKFRKRPVVIDAVQFTGTPIDGVVLDVEPHLHRPAGMAFVDGWTVALPFVRTLEGPLHVSVGDWIVTGIKGEKYPCKPDVFAQAYEKDSPTWPYVLAFAVRMEAKLDKNRHKGNREGWVEMSVDELLRRLREEVRELEASLMPGLGGMDPARLAQLNRGDIAELRANEAADVANFAMMIADKCGGVKP